MGRYYTTWIKLVLVAVFAFQVYLAATRPIGQDEAWLYDQFVRPTARQVLDQQLLNRDVLYGLLEKRSVGLFHVSAFAVRLPSLLFGALYLWVIWRLSRRFQWAWVAAIIGAWPVLSRATGTGAAFALSALAVCLTIEYLYLDQSDKPWKLNLAGACFGLAIAARLDFVVPVIVLELAAFAILETRKAWTIWAERLLIPATVTALVFLVLPLTHAHAPMEPVSSVDTVGAQVVLRKLQEEAGNRSVKIGASSGLASIANFYRAQHRLNTWDRVSGSPRGEPFDYYLLAASDSNVLESRHLWIVVRTPGLLLAKSPE